MKKFDNLMQNLDHKVDQRILPIWHHIKRYFTVFSSTVLLVLLGLFVYKVFRSKPLVLASVITEDLRSINKIFNDIDNDCNILSIRGDRNPIDFLTVQKFVGSEVGCFNLAYPRKWKGPYLKVTPSIQDKPYEIVRTKEGYFVVPGHGVQLPNGLFMGHDVALDFEASIKTMTRPGGRLNYQGNPLAFRLSFKIGDWDAPRPSDDRIEQINDMLKEFNEAIPFAKLEVGLYPTISC